MVQALPRAMSRWANPSTCASICIRSPPVSHNASACTFRSRAPSGAQIRTLLETQFSGCNGQTATRILQVSRGFHYAYTAGNACNARVTSMSLDGVAVDPSASYRVTVNSFLADGGDGFAVLKDGTQRLGGAVDTDAFEAYLQANPSGVAPGPQNRITKND